MISQLTIRNLKEMVAKAPAGAATIASTSITDRAVARSKRRSGRLVAVAGTGSMGQGAREAEGIR